jgi:DNA-3-methyladenine glycosylase
MKPKRLERSFFIRPTLKVAKEPLGKYFVRRIACPHRYAKRCRWGRKKFIGKIVEAEAYIGPKDRASHAYGGKVTRRNKTEYLEGGHIDIYLCYGMYWQLNITTEKEGKPECVLIRALEPSSITNKNPKSQVPISKQIPIPNHQNLKLKKLASGPGKLCKWLKLNKSFNGEDLARSKRIWIEDRVEKIKSRQIVATKRIGIDYAGNLG